MLKFNYTARKKNGELIHGVMDAISEDEVVNRLQGQDLLVTSVSFLSGKDIGKKRRGRKFHAGVKTDDLVLFSRQLSTLLNAGVPLLRSLDILSKQVESKKLYDALQVIKADIEGGFTFHDALKKHSKIFSDFWINLAETGEASGQLSSVLEQVANYIEAKGSLQRKIKSAMLYPVIISIVAAVAVLVFLLKIIPTFADIFQGFNIELPLLTRMVMKASDIFRYYFVIVIGIVIAAVIFFKKWAQTNFGKQRLDAFKLSLPLIGPLLQEISVSRFASALSTLIKSGVPILHCLSIVSTISGNKLFEDAITKVREKVQEGGTMAGPLEESDLFPPMVSQMITVGEESGELGDMLEKISDFYEERVTSTVGRLTAAFEPIMLVLMGGVVGVLIVSMYLPIFKLTKIAG
ncbi:MAG: type II secretion system F family protein [Candidatus Omnitrophica bacterium]|nr:type II secretion system F family protein [Candidatus Omnitrophota bacterium]